MIRFPFYCYLFILAMLQFNSVDAQKLTDNWRVLTKTITHQNGDKNVYEYLYSYDNRIKSVKYLSARGALFLSIINFNFNRNNKPESYTVQYNDGGRINVRVKYDGQGRVSELEKVFGSEISVFNYRYSGTSIVVTQKLSNSANPLEKGNTITFYTEQGDYNVTTSDPLTQTITSVITLKKNMDPEIFPHPDEFMGGFEPPRFLGVLAFGGEPKITATKDENGLITSLSYIARGSNRTFEYTYVKVKSSEPVTTIPVENIPATIITTNINCAAGKAIVERKLKSQDGVQSVNVDIRTGKLSLVLNSDRTSVSKIIDLISTAGYDANRTKSTNPEKNICNKNSKPGDTFTKQSGINIFDARKGFAKTPIKFVPFVVTPDAAKKGFKMDSVYTWVAPDGKTKQASGSEILEQVNEMEKELSLRGQTLRKRNVFSTLSYKLVNPNALLKIPAAATKKAYTSKVKTDRTKISKIPVIKTKYIKLLEDLNAKTISSDVGIYFGSIGFNKEFPGSISTSVIIDNTKCYTPCPLNLMLSLDDKMIKSMNISNCVLEISADPNRKPNDDEVPAATANFNFKSPAKTQYGLNNISIAGDEVPPSNHTLYYFPLKPDLSKMVKAAAKPAYYYAYVKFYDDKGQLLYYRSYNTPVLINQIPPFNSDEKNLTADFGDTFLDPTGMFGVYYQSKNLNAAYSKKRDDETLLITENTKLSGDISLGAQYYNFWHLLDNDNPKYERKSFIDATFSSEYTNKYIEGEPGIRIPGADKSNDMNKYGGYQVNYSLYNWKSDKSYNKGSQYKESLPVEHNIFEQRFFIGPVPCRLKVDLKGSVSLSRTATMDTLKNGNVSITAGVTPHLDLEVEGSGGVDAGIAYATVICNVTLIEMDMPISLKAGTKTDINAEMKIGALKGNIYFTAGLCIPIPWFDDICTDFRIDIYKWDSPLIKTIPLVK